MAQPLTEMAKDLTLALIENNLLPPEDMQQQLAKTHASLLELKAHEDEMLGGRAGQEAPIAKTPAPQSWKKSIKKHSVECLICGQTFKQLSARHLRQHDLNPRTYRQQFGIPRTQPLSAKETTAIRRQVVQNIRPWEKAPTYMQAHPSTPVAPPKRSRKKVAPANQE
jgi:predicted transcriptional regulator